MEEILDPKKPWNIECAAWGIHLKKEPATNRLQPGGLRSSTERATRELAETSPYGFRRFDRDCFCAFMSSSTNKKESVVCSLALWFEDEVYGSVRNAKSTGPGTVRVRFDQASTR